MERAHQWIEDTEKMTYHVLRTRSKWPTNACIEDEEQMTDEWIEE